MDVRKIVTTLILGLCIISCASQPALNDIDTNSTNKSSSNYLIGPGDNIEIFVWRHPDLSRSIPVRPDGKISVPLVEDIVANGKNLYGIGQRH